MVENEALISIKLEDCSEFKDQEKKELLLSCFDKLIPLLQNYNSIELNFRLPRKSKDIFWKTQQLLKKLQSLKGAKYFDSREWKEKELIGDKCSFFSSKTQYKNLMQDIHEGDMGDISKLMLSSFTDINNEEHYNLDDFLAESSIHKAKSDESPIDKKREIKFLFKIEIKDYVRFQAFSTMLQDEKLENETKFPGLGCYPLKIKLKKGNKWDNSPHFIEFYEIDCGDKSEKIPPKQIFEKYINGLVYHRFKYEDLQKFKNQDVERVLLRLKEEIPSLKHFKDRFDNILLVAKANKKEFIRIFEESVNFKIFDDPIMSSVKDITSSTTEEETIDYYKLLYISEEKEFGNKIILVTSQYNIKNFQIDKIKNAKFQELSFKYEASENNARKFRLYYKEKIEKIQARCIYNIPEKIFSWIRNLVADKQFKYFDNEGNALIRIYYTLLYKNKTCTSHRSIVILGSDSSSNEFVDELETIQSSLHEEKEKFCRFAVSYEPEIFFFLKNVIGSFVYEKNSEFSPLDFQIDEENKTFYISTRKEYENEIKEHLKNFVNDRLLDSNSFNFKEMVIWKAFYHTLPSKGYRLSENEMSTSINLKENVIIYVDWKEIDKSFKENQPILNYTCYRKFSQCSRQILQETLENYQKNLKVIKKVIPYVVFKELMENKSTNFERKTLTELNLYDPNLNKEFSHHLSSFSLKNQIKISIFSGDFHKFNEKSVNIVPFDLKTGEILSHIFPLIKKSSYEKFISELKENFEKSLNQRSFHIIEKREKRKKQVFLYGLLDISKQENYFDYFDENNTKNGIVPILKALSKQNSFATKVTIFFTEVFSLSKELFVEELIGIVGEINQMNNSCLENINFFHPSKEIMMNFSSKMKEKTKQTFVPLIQKSIEWYYLDENRDWRCFDAELNSFLEKAFEGFLHSRSKLENFLFYEKSHKKFPQYKETVIEIDLIEERVFVDKLKKCMLLKTFLQEIEKEEWPFLSKEKNVNVFQGFKDIGLKKLKLYAFMPDLPLHPKFLLNNTTISTFNLKSNVFLKGNERGKTIQKLRIKRSPYIKKEIENENLKHNQIFLGINQCYEFTEKGKEVQIWIKGFDQNLKNAEKELEKITNHVLNDPLNDTTLPINWEPFLASDSIILYELAKDSLIYQEIKQKTEKTVESSLISKIERIQNREIYKEFIREQNKISKKREKSSGSNQKSLFYGSSVNPVDIYLSKSKAFDCRLDPKCFLTFYPDAKSALKESFINDINEKQIIYADVIIGKTFMMEEGQSWDQEKKIAPKDGDDRFDSVTEKNSQGEFIYRVFELNQAYPEYLITFQAN